MSVRGAMRMVMSYSFARERCVCCGRMAVGNPLCGSCLSERLLGISIDMSVRCSICGRPLLGEKDLCSACRIENRFPHADQVLPVFPYRLWMKMLLYQWKCGDRRSLSPVFAKVLGRGLEEICGGMENFVLVPVPPRPGKIRKRGWDQIEELCGILKRVHGFDVLGLVERFSVEQQKKKDREERLEMKGRGYGPAVDCMKKIAAWSKSRGLPPGTRPSMAVVVDDIITTGATVDSCAAILKDMGIPIVKVLSIAAVG